MGLYWITAAPGLTWAQHGADGGDLIAAAITNGVPHPSGYPFYTQLLRGWLWLGQLFFPQLDLAFWGNRLSALCVAGATLFVGLTTMNLLPADRSRGLWVMCAALAFALTPLAWGQALITEVYGLHALLIAGMGWLALRHVAQDESSLQPATHSDLALGLVMGLGAAHHLTSLLLWPALLYWRLHHVPVRAWLVRSVRLVGVAALVALFWYGSMVWRIATASTPPPVTWGYPRDLAGLWWLVSGAAYRAYVFGMTPPEYLGRLGSLATILVEQFTPVGLALAIGGFAVWDRTRPVLRNGALLWIVPVSLYATGYNTVDSYIYLLPVVWLMSVMIGQALASSSAWLAARFATGARVLPFAVATLLLMSLIALATVRLAQHDLRQDRAAQDFLVDAANTLTPGAIVVSNADAPTFALWYGVWGSGTLARQVPDLIIVNYALYQFGWYRDLMHDLYPDVPMVDRSFAEVVAANRGVRPIFLTEPLPEVPRDALTPMDAFWRVNPP